MDECCTCACVRGSVDSTWGEGGFPCVCTQELESTPYTIPPHPHPRPTHAHIHSLTSIT